MLAKVRAKRRNRLVKPWIDALFQAATAGDLDRLRYLVQTQGCSPSLRDADGYTALHLAYYWERQDAVEALIGFGADQSLPTTADLVPVQMAELARTEQLLRVGISLLSGWGGWRHPALARPVYDRLQRVSEPRIYLTALPLVWACAGHADRRILLLLVIRLGIPAALPWLAWILRRHGTPEMAADYWESGSATLRVIARRWFVSRHSVYINGIRVYKPRAPHRQGSPPSLWGHF
jgi:hypothetical protein